MQGIFFGKKKSAIFFYLLIVCTGINYPGIKPVSLLPNEMYCIEFVNPPPTSCNSEYLDTSASEDLILLSISQITLSSIKTRVLNLIKTKTHSTPQELCYYEHSTSLMTMILFLRLSSVAISKTFSPLIKLTRSNLA
jgi:hypothetical protein